MKRKTAILYGKSWLEDENLDAEDKAFIEEALKALEQEPCKDSISRQAVINITAETGALETQSRVMELPSVNLQPKTGEWIVDKGSLDSQYGEVCKCSNVRLRV